MRRPSLGRRVAARTLRWGAVVAAGAVVTGFGATVGLPLMARAFVGGLRLVLEGFLWLTLAISTGTDMWTIAGTAGRVVAASLVTPQAIGGTGGLLVLGALALLGLRRLLGAGPQGPSDSGKESIQ